MVKTTIETLSVNTPEKKMRKRRLIIHGHHFWVPQTATELHFFVLGYTIYRRYQPSIHVYYTEVDSYNLAGFRCPVEQFEIFPQEERLRYRNLVSRPFKEKVYGAQQHRFLHLTGYNRWSCNYSELIKLRLFGHQIY